MTEIQKITILGVQKVDERVYRMRYEEDGLEQTIVIEFEDSPNVENWALLSNQSMLELADRKPFVSREFFRTCVRVCRGEVLPPITVSSST